MGENITHMAGGLRFLGKRSARYAGIDQWSEKDKLVAAAVLKTLSELEPVAAAQILMDRVLLAEKAFAAGLSDQLSDNFDITSTDPSTLDELSYAQRISDLCPPDVLTRINDQTAYITENE